LADRTVSGIVVALSIRVNTTVGFETCPARRLLWLSDAICGNGLSWPLAQQLKDLRYRGRQRLQEEKSTTKKKEDDRKPRIDMKTTEDGAVAKTAILERGPQHEIRRR